MLTVYSLLGEKLFSSKVDGNIVDNPTVFIPGSKGLPLFSMITEEGKGYVIKGDGSIYAGFPFESIFAPTVVKASEKNNIVGALRVTPSGEIKYYRIAQ